MALPQTPAAAIIDIKMKDGPCTAVALLLHSRAVPLIICSGSDKADVPEIFSKGAWIRKPARDEAVIDALVHAMSSREMSDLLEREA